MMVKKALVAGAAGFGLVLVLTAVQLSLIEAVWSTQQWLLAVILPLAGLTAMVAGGLALWSRSNRTRPSGLRSGGPGSGGPGSGDPQPGDPRFDGGPARGGGSPRGRYRARHAWQARRWIARTSPMMGEPEAVAVRLR